MLRRGDAVCSFAVQYSVGNCNYKSNLQTWGTIFDKCGQIMAYADDVIMGRRLQDVEVVFTSLIKQTNKIGSEINEKKKKENLWLYHKILKIQVTM